MKHWISCIVLGLVCATSQAESPRVRWYANIGYASGGDSLVNGRWIDSSTGEVVGTFELKAGDGYVWSMGADTRLGDAFTLQASLGYQNKHLKALNANLSFERTTAELLGFYSVTPQFRIGGGARKSFNARVTGSDDGATFAGVGPYESSPGAVLEFQYLFNETPGRGRELVTGLQLRFVKETFRLADGYGSTDEKSGNHIALGLLFYY